MGREKSTRPKRRRPRTKITRPTIAYTYGRKFKPSIQPVPAPLWYQNLRTYLGPYRWYKLRRAVINSRNLNCEVCGVAVTESRKLMAHEVWAYSYRSGSGIARVKRLALVCWFCHSCEHFALTQKLVGLGVLTQRAIDETIDHFCRLNQVPRRQFDICYTLAMAEWEHLSGKQWVVDWGKFKPLIVARETA